MLQTIFSHDDFIVWQNTVDEVIADEPVQRILAVSEIIIIFTGVSWVNSIVNFLGMCNQFVNVVDAVFLVDRIRLNESGKFEVAFLNPLDWVGTFCLTFQ